MPTYFKPLRRKIGVVTLMVACVFAGEWVRSPWDVDLISYLSDSRTFHVVYSCPLGIGYTRLCELEGTSLFAANRFGLLPVSVESIPATQGNLACIPFQLTSTPGEINWNTNHWESQWYGFRMQTFWQSTIPTPPTSVQRFQVWIIPHWSIVVPMTLLSAYLLLDSTHPRRWNVTHG